MRLKKEFSKQDSVALFFCVGLPPLGFILASRKQWVSLAIAIVASFLYCGAFFGWIVSGYPRTINDFVNLNALWGLVMTISIGGRYLASRNLTFLINILLLFVLGLLILMYTPWENFNCILNCKEIIFRTLRGEAVKIVPGTNLAIFLLSLYSLFGIAVFLCVANGDS